MEVNEQLNQIRHDIDAIDSQILDLLNRRAELALQTLPLKKKTAIYHPEREREIIHKCVSRKNNKLRQTNISNIFSEIIKACRQLQQQQKHSHNELNLSIQGITGSFSEMAAEQYLLKTGLKANFIYDVHSRGVVNRVIQNENTLGVLAINNDQGGIVEETISALTNQSYLILDTVGIAVRQCLVAKKTDKTETLRTVISHSHALRQCNVFLNSTLSHCEIKEESDTAIAAMKLASGEYAPHTGVIASEQAAKQHKLQILQRNIQTCEDNTTLFVIIKKR